MQILQRWTALCVLLMTAMISQAVLAQDEEAAAAESEGSQYIDLKPAFIANYGGVGRLRYLKAEIALRVGGGAKGPAGIRHHMPQIRHSLVMLMSRQTEEDISTMEGKEMLRQNALTAVREVLLKEDGEQYIQDLLFKSFIVQR